jgi:hypothetical protein
MPQPALKPIRRKRQTLEELQDLQRLTLRAVIRPLTNDDDTQPIWFDGRDAHQAIGEFIKPNDRLTSFERLEIYNRQYWYRLIDIMYEDWPGLRAVVGDRAFNFLIRAYLDRYPSKSFSFRELGRNMPRFLEEQPHWGSPRQLMAQDVARFEWAQTIAFDEPACEAITVDDLLGRDPATMTVSLQPYITLLELSYPLDKFSIRVRREALRSEASNAADMDRAVKRQRKITLPRKQRIFVAVHRYRGKVFYKRLIAESYRLLCSLRDGETLECAIGEALPPNADARWGKKLREWFSNWTELGWLCAPHQSHEVTKTRRKHEGTTK